MVATERKRLWTARFVNLLAFDIVYQLGSYMTNTIVSVYAVGLGATYAVAGLLAGLNPGASMVLHPVTGLLADLFGKKKLLVASSVLFLVATLGCFFFQSFFLIGFFRILQGLSFALRSVCVISLVARVAPKEKLASGMGWIGLASTLSTAVGPLLAETVGEMVGYRNCFLAAGALLLAGVLLAMMFKAPPEGDGAKKGAWRFAQVSWRQMRQTFGFGTLFYKKSLPLATLAGLSGVPHGVSVSLILLIAAEKGIEGAPLFFTFYALTALVARPLLGRLADSVGARKVALPLFAVELASSLVLAFMTSTAMLVAAAVLLGLGQSSLYSILQAESVREVDASEAGRAASTFYLGPDINMCFSPVIGGILLGAFGPSVPYLFGAAAVVFAMCVFVHRELKRR